MKTNKKNHNKKKKSHIPFRLNFLFFTVFLLFAMLILRLGYLQIVKGEEFETEVQRTETTLATGTVPRGEIYDNQQRKLVGNEALQAITYTRGTGVSSEDMATIAVNLAAYIEMPNITEFEQDSDFDLSKRDLKDFWISMNEDKVNDRISDKQKDSLNGSELYQLQVDKVTDEDIQFSKEEQEAAAIFKRMNGAYALSTINIKGEDVSNDEIAKVSENLLDLPGIDTGTDWVRTYPEKDMLKTILGNVTSESKGLPKNKAATYLAQGYARNDRVGESYLELEYEQVLSGSKSQSETETNQNGDVVNTIQSYTGEKGDNLVLTIDMDFQTIVQDLAKESLVNESEGLNDRIYVVAADPNNGEILAMTGQKRETNGEIKDDTLGIITNTYQMGSVVKPATVLAGYMDGAITLADNTLIDEPLTLAGQKISSVFNRSGSVAVNDITALERSSNVYMAKLAMRMGGEYDYYQNMALNIDYKNVIKRLRNYYAQFGLGVKTGIDLPGEGSGFIGTAENPGLALTFAFGQYDTYTPIQMLQYVSTVANGGKRIAPRLIDEIRETNAEGNLGAIQTQLESDVLNILDVGEEEISRVQQGMYEVVNGANGSATSYFGGIEYTAAGKTGTAEAYYDGDIKSKKGESVTNRTFIGYAPYDDPEIAVFVIVPYLPNSNSNHENTVVARKVLDAYFQVGDYADLSNDIAEENEATTEE
ncbi:cell elongation-specific peptidoglycan D,D-transpeptidase [Carnobacterium alterfunditum]|uniref:Cell elongation-specific peptidoglycan D,D-transpeptidase n=1 Tax=Carnobacterium alterfunditum TaxID=28230 RepID=A0A1N6H940_9LACT|nr:penicillin-binding protein 2 [Carnobacterium alterfunditum]SIO16215.1 cell elongation-specific peptidoglycan D,D-transpeptidase [Carnobacterium alterfunditum]